jgi:diguanylate cyclase (GGDEF)-like protein
MRSFRPAGSKIVREQGQLLADRGQALRDGLGRRGRGHQAFEPSARAAVRSRTPERPRGADSEDIGSSSARLLAALPQGRLLPDALWRRRHFALVLVLWLQVPALAIFGLARGYPPLHLALDMLPLAGLALVAGSARVPRRARAIAASLGLVSCSALLVHLWDGRIEAHFHFFVMVSLLMLYQDWVPFLIAFGYVVVHHGLLGMIAAGSVFDHPNGEEQPWLWAGIHGGFILAACAANMVAWRANELLVRDPLTRLPTRVVLLDRLRTALDQGSGLVGAIFLDLDRFKLVNDSLGHDAGDRLLELVADRLRAGLQPGDEAFRFGGDELIVLCHNLPDREAAVAIAERIAATLREPYALEGRSIVLTVSVGIAVGAPGTCLPEEMLRDADAAMYRAKELGKDRCELFDAALRARVVERLEVEAGLRRALERGELEVHYQPEVSLASGRMEAVEALVRWRHPERGLVAPGEFIGVAEDTGLIVPLGAWVLETACRQTAAWREEHGGPLTARVNVSARQLAEPGLVETIAEVLASTGTQAGDLCLELTESDLMADVETSAAALARLRAVGVQIALDDFGTGYSSLNYLRRFEVDLLKIDRSFVRHLAQRPADGAIVEAIVAMAHALGLRVTAEGVETSAQLEQVRGLGCEAVQGFLFARPGPPEEIGALLASELEATVAAPL